MMAQESHLLHLLIALTATVVTARLVGALFSRMHQPSVIGEVLAGIMLGPSLLGHFAPQVQSWILPPSVVPLLSVIAQLGIVLYMFVVGLHFDLKTFRENRVATFLISPASMVLPFALGFGLAYTLQDDFMGANAAPLTFALFVGVSLSITAFPVLARILDDRGITHSPMGVVALSCAAIDDVLAWCLLALVVSFANSDYAEAWRTIGLTILFVAFMFTVVRPAIKRFLPWLEKFDRLTDTGISIFFVALLLSALTTEMIGIHALFGSFLMGVIVPAESRVTKELTQRIEDLVRILLLPAFFAFTGLRTQIGALHADDWGLCLLIVMLATTGKFGGTVLAGRASGLSWRNASALGVLMNTRGLVELIVLNIGLDLQIISPRLFTLLVIMALVTTFATSPIFTWLTRHHPWTTKES